MTELLTALTKLTSWGACWGLRDEAHSRGRNYPFPQRIHTLASGVMNTHRSEGFSRSSVSKESACNAGDPGLIPGSGRPLGEGNATHSSSLAWKIPSTEEPGGLQSMGSQEPDRT